MKWSEDAESAIKQVPFFVRKKVRKRVEEDARKAGKREVSIQEVKNTRKRFLSGMDKEVKGYQLDSCFGPGGCPNTVIDGTSLLKKIEEVLEKEDLKSFLKKTVEGPLKFHHEFRITIAECPNACSQPQIKDVGIIGASVPRYQGDGCTCCGACAESCQEQSVTVDENAGCPVFDMKRCVFCGKCIAVCPESVVTEAKKGYRIQLGGKLGRHPRLASELQGIYSETEVVEITKRCLRFYKENSTRGKRFADLIIENEWFLKSII